MVQLTRLQQVVLLIVVIAVCIGLYEWITYDPPQFSWGDGKFR